MSKRLTRRQFLRVSGLAAAASVVSGCTVKLQRTEYLESYVRPPEEELPGQNIWFATTCRQCSAGCGIIVRTSNGRARKIEGNPQHPINAGKLCGRGQAALQELYDADRLRNAVRQPARGSLGFEPLYWEDALSELSQQMRAANPGSIAFLAGNVSTHLWQVMDLFTQGLGAPAPVLYSLGDDLTGQQGLSAASGSLFGSAAVPIYDLASADAVFSFSANFLETEFSTVFYNRAYSRMRRRPLGQRGLLVQFEPRLSSTGASADEWVRIRPGTEGLMALALGKIVAESGLAAGSAPAGFYDEVDVGQVAEASGVSAEDIERLARTFISVPSPVAIPGSRLLARPGGDAAVTAVQTLNLLTGKLGTPGGVYLPPAPAGDAFSPPPPSTYADVRTLIGDMDAGRVQALFVYGANPVFELPLASGFRDALANVPLVVSFSPTVDDTAAQADLILPDRTNLESWGYHVPTVSAQTVVSGLQPVIQPLYDTRAAVDVLLALAQELGGAVSQAVPWQNEVEFLREAIAPLNTAGASGDAYWSQWRRLGGYWTDQDERRAPQAGTPQPVSVASLTPEAAPADFPYELHLYPSVSLFDGRGANKPWLQETPDPMTTVAWQTWIEMHPDMAEELHLKDGDIVRVVSLAGTIEAVVYVYPGIPQHVVGMPIGRGHENYGRFAKGYGSNPLILLSGDPVEGTGAAAWNSTLVRIVSTGRRRDLARLESPAGVEFMLEEGELSGPEIERQGGE